jgi:glycerophosphoryl diester phosphodiesterase
MQSKSAVAALVGALIAVVASTGPAAADRDKDREEKDRRENVQVGPRPFYLVDQMTEGQLKKTLEQCKKGPFARTDFSIGHRGAGLQFPEHTLESYEAAIEMGAGIVECDVTFTKDAKLVCRHAQCDLATTTNILTTPLASTCAVPFTPASGNTPAKATCCTSDLSLTEFKSLKGKMDSSNPAAQTPAEFQGGVPAFRTSLYNTGATLMTHKESIALNDSHGVNFTPELKEAEGKPEAVGQVFPGGQAEYAQRMIDEYKEMGINPKRVFAQSFNPADILYWLQHEPAFGKQAVWLESRDANVDPADPDDPGLVSGPTLQQMAAQGVKIVAPPMWYLVKAQGDEIVPSKYARKAKAAKLDIITWTLERSGRIVEDVLEGGNNYYFQSTDGSHGSQAIFNDGDYMTTLDVLAKKVGIIGIFSDWPGTVTYYANCMGLK